MGLNRSQLASGGADIQANLYLRGFAKPAKIS